MLAESDSRKMRSGMKPQHREEPMKHMIFAALLSFAMVACMHTPSTKTPNMTDQKSIGMYYWDLTDAKNKTGQRIDNFFVREKFPVRLSFSENRLFVNNTCNNMSGSYSLKDGTITFGQMASTRKLCADEKLNRLDQKVQGLLQGTLSYTLTFAVPNKPSLVLKTSTGEALYFTGIPTPETRYGNAGETIFLEVAAQTRACSHPLSPGMQCLQVREIYYDEAGKRSTSGGFENFYPSIEGYVHQPGTRNVLRVKRYKIQNPPADASNLAYVLDLVVESEIVKP